jgi:hypothetical protein
MEFIDIFELSEKKFIGRRSTQGVTIGSLQSPEPGKSTTRISNVIRLASDVAQAARLLPGDRCKVLISNCGNKLLLTRTNDGSGFALSLGNGGKKSEIKQNQFYALNIKFTVSGAIPEFGEKKLVHHEITKEGVLIHINQPKDF